jgi:hypothetical protein
MAQAHCSVLAFAAVAILHGCSIGAPAGEQLADCNDGRDNDGDYATDCEDTDCQALSVCGPGAPVTDASLPPSQIGDAFVGEADAGMTPPTHLPPVPPPEVDSSTPDTGPEPPPADIGCPGGCAANEHCVVNECLANDVVVADVWTISRIDVRVPRSVEMGSDPACLDATCAGFFLRRAPYFGCECPPDPQVQVWVDADPYDELDVALAGQTTTHTKQDQTRWTEPIELRLLAASIVQMKVIDVDGDSFEPVFGCEIPGASALISSAGTLECKQMFPTADVAGAIEFSIIAEFEPTLVE